MNTPYVQCPDNEEAAHAVYRHTQTLPAFRHFRLDRATGGGRAFGEWWLVPGPERPPYRYGKLFFARAHGDPNAMASGFCFHRGVGRHLNALVDPDAVMGANWFWSRFLSDALAGVFDAPLREMMTRSEQPARVSLTLYHLNHAPGPETTHAPDDRLTFTVDEATLALRPDELGEEELAPLSTASGLRDLALWIESMQDLWWYWIDVHIGIRLRYGDEDSGGWDAPELWRRALEPWSHWVH